MNTNLVEKEGKRYVEIIPGKLCIESEQDALDVIGMCGSFRTNVVMLNDGTLTDSFFDLKTGIAGSILQKFINYRVRIAAILAPERIKGRFGEMVYESHKGSDFRVFKDKEQAEEWLMAVYKWPVG